MIERTQLTIYKNCAIIPEKNFKVDDLEAYLSTLTHIDYQNSQVIKHDLTTKYKIQLEQRELELANNNYNYCKFLNQEKTGESQWSSFNYIYYFIVNKKWVSSECIELELEMDVLNTIKNYVSLSEKTIILREHKNRWENASEPNLYLPKIDFYSEGLIPPLFKTAEVDLYQVEHDEYVEGSWYLIYRSHTDQENSPIDILLCGDSEITVDVNATGGFSGMLNRISIKDGGYNPDYVVYGGDNNIGCSITFKYWTSRKEYDYATFTITEPSQCFIWNGKQIFFGNVSENGFVETHHYIYGIIANKSFEEVDFTNLICLRQGVPYSVLRNPENLTTTIISSMHKNSTIENYVGEHGTIETIASVNRTDPKLLKIVKLPYRPLSLTFDEDGNLSRLPDGWAYEGTLENFPHMLKYVNEGTTNALTHEMYLYGDENYENPYSILEYETQPLRNKIMRRLPHYETKLLHSDYFIQKFVYDSYTFEFKAEHMESDGGPQMLYVNYAVSLTMSSKFLFQFPFTSFGYGLKLDTQDYSGIVYIARNNELPIFNSAYLNYIRTGYNYDIKTRNRQLASSIVGGVLSTIGAVASAVGGGPVGVASAIALETSSVSQFTRAFFNTAQADQNIAQKLKQAEMQGLSVAGADDVDLMTIYTNDNKAKLVKYEVSERMRKVLFDLFYYCGYIANYQGIPDETSRKVFNFVQADIIFNTLTHNISKPLIDKYKEKYNEGITIIHHYTLQNALGEDVRGWDFEQQYENWETTTSA